MVLNGNPIIRCGNLWLPIGAHLLRDMQGPDVMSGVEIIGVVSSIVTLVDATIKICKSTKDLPQDLRVIAESLPLIHEVVKSFGQNIHDKINDDTRTVVYPALRRCELNTRTLRDIIRGALPRSNESSPERAVRASRVIFGRVKEARALMGNIRNDFLLLQQQYAFQNAELLENLDRGLEKLAQLAIEESGGKYINSGSGPQYNNVHGGWGAQTVTNNFSSGGSGSAYFGTNQTFHKS